jgi:acetyl-CoA/propionyl-CoA carboxylase biotin carboxyl carrier protein
MKDLVVEVEGKRLTVSVPRFLVTGESSSIPKIHRRKKTHQASTHTGAKGNSLLAPMQATVVKLAVSDGQMVQEGELVVVLEAMKMEQPLTAHRAGKIANVGVSVGSTISAGTRILDILD